MAATGAFSDDCEQPAGEDFRRGLRDALAGNGKQHFRLYAYRCVGSTMDVAARIFGGDPTDADRAASAGSTAGPIAVFAERQSAGRGRAARVWHSEDSAGIYATFLFSAAAFAGPAAWPAEISLAGFSLAAGVAVHRALENFGAVSGLKWPNDVLIRGDGGLRKVAGVLTEASSAGNTLRFASVGIGLNVSQSSFPAQVPGISLKQHLGRSPDYFEVAGALAGELYAAAARFFAGGFAQFAEEWNQRSFMCGAQISVRESGESAAWVGLAQGVASDGGLIVVPSGSDCRPRVLYSAEIELL